MPAETPPVEYCDCGHRVTSHKDNSGRCLYCRCQGVVQAVQWVTDDREKDGEA